MWTLETETFCLTESLEGRGWACPVSSQHCGQSKQHYSTVTGDIISLIHSTETLMSIYFESEPCSTLR